MGRSDSEGRQDNLSCQLSIDHEEHKAESLHYAHTHVKPHGDALRIAAIKERADRQVERIEENEKEGEPVCKFPHNPAAQGGQSPPQGDQQVAEHHRRNVRHPGDDSPLNSLPIGDRRIEEDLQTEWPDVEGLVLPVGGRRQGMQSLVYGGEGNDRQADCKQLPQR